MEPSQILRDIVDDNEDSAVEARARVRNNHIILVQSKQNENHCNQCLLLYYSVKQC